MFLKEGSRLERPRNSLVCTQTACSGNRVQKYVKRRHELVFTSFSKQLEEDNIHYVPWRCGSQRKCLSAAVLITARRPKWLRWPARRPGRDSVHGGRKCSVFLQKFVIVFGSEVYDVSWRRPATNARRVTQCVVQVLSWMVAMNSFHGER